LNLQDRVTKVEVRLNLLFQVASVKYFTFLRLLLRDSYLCSWVDSLMTAFIE